MSKMYTTNEVREMFLKHCHTIINYWLTQQSVTNLDGSVTMYSERDRAEGIVFSILAMIDGCSVDIPGFILAPIPHEDNKNFHQKNGENWFPENHDVVDDIIGDIAGSLHEQFCKVKK